MAGATKDRRGELVDRRMLTEPSAYWTQLGADGPVRWSEHHRGWLVLSHAEVSDAFRDHRLSADRVGSLERAAAHHPEAFARTVELLSGWMIFRDPPAHTRLRDPVRVAFTPRRVERLSEEIVSLTHELLDEATAAGRLDVREELASPLPGLVIAELLGVPRELRARFRNWSDDLAEIVFSIRPTEIDPAPVSRATDEFIEFFTALISQYRAEPEDNLISALVHNSQGLSEMELVGACTLLLFAGHETTTNLLTTAIGHLATHPDDLARLHDDASLDATAVEEFVRTMGPAATMVRKVGIGHDRAGHHLEPGQTMYLSIAAANHDTAVYDDPDRVNLSRDPNPHLGFGWGPHHCLGVGLARLETRLVLREVVNRFPNLRPDDGITDLSGDALGRARIRVPLLV